MPCAALQEAVLLVHELRQQVVTQQSQQASSSKPAGATAGSASTTPSSPPCRAKPRSTANSPSQRTRSPQQGAKGAAVTSSIAAARSSLFTRAATDRAVAEWHQSKLQQQADAALAQQQQCAREEQLLDQLTAMEEAAVAQHEQVGQCGTACHCCCSNSTAYKQGGTHMHSRYQSKLPPSGAQQL